MKSLIKRMVICSMFSPIIFPSLYPTDSVFRYKKYDVFQVIPTESFEVSIILADCGAYQGTPGEYCSNNTILWVKFRTSVSADASSDLSMASASGPWTECGDEYCETTDQIVHTHKFCLPVPISTLDGYGFWIRTKAWVGEYESEYNICEGLIDADNPSEPHED